MKVYLASTFSDEDGPMAEEGKTVYIQASKDKILELSAYFASVAAHVESSGACHMHFRDHSKGWSKEEYIDIAVDIVENT